MPITILSPSTYNYLGIAFPSGQIAPGLGGSNLEAYLISMRASMGFNNDAHQFETDWIPTNYIDVTNPASGHGHGASGNLPNINSEIALWVSGFYIQGNITHADWRSADNGTTLSVSIRDKRNNLNRYKITNEDLGNEAPSGLISIARYYRESNGITQSVARNWPATSGSGIESITSTESLDTNFKEYLHIINDGATYPQILSAISGVIGSGLANQFPTVADIQSNIGGDINSLRFKFNLSPLKEMMTDIAGQTAFDWYWNMGGEKINLINKKIPFTVSEYEILGFINAYGGSGLDNVKSISYGKDLVEEPSRIHLIGAPQEGIMNSALLSPIDGLDTIYDGVAPSSTLVFYPVWSYLTVGFYDADGFYRTYVPGEKELQMAIAGHEQWSYFKKYQSDTAPSGWNMPADAGSIAAQHPDFQSRLDPRQPISALLSNPSGNIRVINNRRDINSNWTINFYERIAQHATRHYGKSYIATDALIRNNKVFKLISSAWCNVENQREVPSGLFTDDYEISRQYGPISPFLGADAKVSAYVKLPSGTVYGPLGEDTPASFAAWTEDAQPFNPSGDGSHYIPCDLAIVGSRTQDPRNGDSFSFDDFPEQTILCQLPDIAASGTIYDDVLGSLSTLTEYALSLEQSGIIDLIDPRRVVVPYSRLSGVAVPVQSNTRYGELYPDVWLSGVEHPIYGTKIDTNDDLAPWIEFPEGSETSVQKLDRHAKDRINSLVSNQLDSQFLEIQQVGLPAISFDSFASQTPNASGLVGARNHGTNFVSIDYGAGGLTTTYKIQSYFVGINKPNALVDRTRFRINGVLNPIDFTDLGNFLATFGNGKSTTDNLNNKHGVNNLINFDFERREACEVITIHNIFDETACNQYLNGQSVPLEERYFAIVKRKRRFAYGETHYTLSPGINNVGHNLNSLQVRVTFVASGIGIVKLPYIEIDPYTVAISNNLGTDLFGTVMISNGEGVIRPTNGDIRDSDEVDDWGAVCNDGFLNLGDPCVYNSKRTDGELLCYFTGGRPLTNGMIVEVQQNEGNGLYSVSLLGDRHGRWIAGIPSLNNVPLTVGQQMPIAPTA